jgi:hypothetical protein
MSRSKRHSEIDQIISKLRYGGTQVVVILFIPSHDKKEKRLNNQDQWTGVGMELFGKLFTGATAFQALDGIFVDEDGTTYHDKPILIESYAEEEAVQDEGNLRELLDFIKRMGRETNQAAVALVIHNALHLIRKFS